jgi:hypothetical protein
VRPPHGELYRAGFIAQMVVTRNVEDFAPMNVGVLNPFAG